VIRHDPSVDHEKSMQSLKLTPMIEQYLSIKGNYTDCILFYRMGDFYEMFFEDAVTASRVLEITLTSRNKNDEAAVPMCGVPHRAAQAYIAKLIASGFKVAICDQVEDPSVSKGLVKRDVVRVITPGMVVENELLDAGVPNYVLAVYSGGKKIGIAYVDISTGEFRLTEVSKPEQAVDEIQRIDPKEILLSSDATIEDSIYKPLKKAFENRTLSHMDSAEFSYAMAKKRLLTHFQTLTLEGFGCETLKAAVSAAGAVVAYVSETQKQSICHISTLHTYHTGQYLLLDEASCRNLELFTNIGSGGRQGTLMEVINKTMTPMGGRCLREWIRRPLIDAEAISHRLDAVTEAKEKISAVREIREHLASIHDLERLSGKVAMGQVNARDLVALKQSLGKLPSIRASVGKLSAFLFEWEENLEALNALTHLIETSIREDAPATILEGGMVKEGFHSELDELVRISRDGKGYLAALETSERERTSISSLKVRYNKVFGYYIEVSRTHAEKIPDHYIRKQTLVNAERYITDDLKKFETKVMGAEEERARLEYRLFIEIKEKVMAHIDAIQRVSRYLERLDCLTTFAHVAEQSDYSRPHIDGEGGIWIEDGRHPVVEKMIPAERFVPNTIQMDNAQNQVLIITGPNMAGKSTVLRQVALITLLAQMGSFVPAKNARIGIVDRIFTRVGALDNLSSGQSTFMVEMQETAAILNGVTPKSLVILDEIGRGTSTFDGMSIAWAVATYLHDLKGKGVKTLFATHYHELTELSNVKPRVQNFNIAVKEWNDQIIFLRKLVEGGTNRSYGIQVGRLAGLPEPVIREAKKMLAKIEFDHYSAEKKEAVGTRKGPVQMSLFQDPKEKLLTRLMELDVAEITPLEALRLLDEMVATARTMAGK
jgi:DNA mismatch repair protein MutS